MNITLIGTGSYSSPLAIRPRGLGRQLAAQRHRVTLIVPRADKYNDFTPKPVSDPDMTIVQPWHPASRSAIVSLLPYLLTMPIALLRSRPDVIIISKATPITVAGLLGRLFGKPVIVDSDDLGSEVMRAEGQPPLRIKLVAWSERLSDRFCTAGVAVSTALQDRFHSSQPSKPVLLLPNAVEPADYTITPASKVRPAVYYYGVINRLEVIEPLLRAIPAVHAAVPAARFAIIGGGAALEEARQLAAQLGIADVVAFPGWQSDMLSVQQFIRFGDIGVCYQPDTEPVRAASNMKVFQYMAMGSVPVVSDVGDLANYVRHGQAGAVVPAGKPAALARTLVELLGDTSRRKRLAQAAYRLARETDSWQQRAVTLYEFIAGLRQAKTTATETAR